MEIKIPSIWKEQIPKSILDKEENRSLRYLYSESSPSSFSKIDIENFDSETIACLIQIASNDNLISYYKRKKIVEQLSLLFEILTTENINNVKILDIKHIPKSMDKLALSMEKYTFFHKDGDIYQPMVYLGSHYYPSSRSNDNPYCKVEFGYVFNGSLSNKNFNFNYSDISTKKETLISLLLSRSIYPFSKDIYNVYLEDLKDFHEKRLLIGRQVLGTGEAKIEKSSYYYSSKSNTSLDYYSEPGKLVIDEEEDVVTDIFTDLSWIKSDDIEKNVKLPIGLYIKCYHLQKHLSMFAHVSNISLYEFNTSLKNKLVLRDDMNLLVSILENGVKLQLEDIVSGKTGGMFVLCTGKPGTGKTLTAEVFAESTSRALYVIQCSQLGISSSKIEENLKLALKRSEKWGAVLLIDEADVYIRQRGDSLEQNAIVGVFLRVLESYQGIIFMTSNIDSIDDAVVSRSLVHIKYEAPYIEELKKIWRIMADNYKLPLSNDNIENLVYYAPNFVGRDIKQICRLMNFMLSSNNSLSLSKVFLLAVKYRGLVAESYANRNKLNF